MLTLIEYMVLWIHKSQPFPNGSVIFAQHNSVTNTQTDRHTDHATCDICSNTLHMQLPMLLKWAGEPSKLPFASGNLHPILNGSLGPSAPKRHLDRFSRFCRAHERDQLTHRQTTLLRLQQGCYRCDAA